MTSAVKPPVWFWVVAILLLLWEAVGVAACVMQLRMGPNAWRAADQYDRALYAGLPVWYNWVYAVATVSGLLGAVASLMRRAVAVPLYIVSAIAVVAMFGYTFAATDLITHKGVLVAAGFPIVIFVIAIIAIWFARTAQARGWIS